MENCVGKNTLRWMKMSFCPLSAKHAQAALWVVSAPFHPPRCCSLVQGLQDTIGDRVLSQRSVPVRQGGFSSCCDGSKTCLLLYPRLHSPLHRCRTCPAGTPKPGGSPTLGMGAAL